MNERTNFIIAYLADITGVTKKLKNLERINSVIAKEFGNDFTKAAKQVGEAVENISKKSIKLKDGTKATQELRTLSTTVKTTDGQLKTLVETQRRVNGALKSSTTAFKEASGGTKNFRQNLNQLITRAALTIPTWFLLRNAVRSVFVTIRDGFKSLAELDNILQKAKRNLSGSADEIEADFKRVKDGIKDLALSTGEDATDIADAFQRFATLGFDAEASLGGATAATKLAILQFDDLDNIANGLARSFKILSGSFKNNKTDSENLLTTVALLDELWKENAFDANELIGALQRFAPTASRLNISLTDSVKLLATLQSAAVTNTRAGRLLGRSFDELAGNIGKLGSVLGLEVNPEAESTVDIFLKVIRTLEKLQKEEGLNPKLQQSLKAIFGGRIGIEAPAGLIAIADQLERNLKLTGDVVAFEKALAEVSATVSRQAKIAGGLKEAFQRSFVEGFFGLEEGVENMRALNRFMASAEKNAKFLGEAIREDIVILRNLITLGLTSGVGAFFLLKEQDAKRTLSRVEQLTGDINKAFFGQLDFKGVADVLTDALGSIERNEGIISENEITQLRKILDELGKGTEIDVKFEPLTKQEVLERQADLERQLQDEKILLEDQKTISNDIVSNELERLRIAGLVESEVLKSKTALNEQLGIGEKQVDLARRELQIQREIREERRLQNDLSSESLKLFRIAQKDGTDVARKISNVLSGDTDFSSFERQGGKAFEVFKKQFSGLFEGEKAEEFFKSAAGSRINIRENLLGRRSRSFSSNAFLEQQRAERILQPKTPSPSKQVQQTNNINITNNITTSNPEEMKRIAEKTYVDGLRNQGSAIYIENLAATENIIGDF